MRVRHSSKNKFLCVIFIVPSVFVNISESGTPTYQQTYILTCNVNVPLSLLPTSSSSYSWSRDGTVLFRETSKQLTINSLQISDNNTVYVCSYMATSLYLTNNLSETSAMHQIIFSGKTKLMYLFLLIYTHQNVIMMYSIVH